MGARLWAMHDCVCGTTLDVGCTRMALDLRVRRSGLSLRRCRLPRSPEAPYESELEHPRSPLKEKRGCFVLCSYPSVTPLTRYREACVTCFAESHWESYQQPKVEKFPTLAGGTVVYAAHHQLDQESYGLHAS